MSFDRRMRLLSGPHLFAAATALSLALFAWPWHWLISGTPLLTYILLLGAAYGYRILPDVPLWTLTASLNLVYALASTSWLLYLFYPVACYFMIFVSCLFQFGAFAEFVRRWLRLLIRQLHFVSDKIALFEIPALEIDTEVDGLLVVRGITFSFSSLTIIAHGIEVGIKLSDDLEIAIQTGKVTISLFRNIRIDDVYANLKGGQYEMTVGRMAGKSSDGDGNALMATTSLPAERTVTDDTPSGEKSTKMADAMVDGSAPIDSSVKDGLDSMKQVRLDDDAAAAKVYYDILEDIKQTSTAQICRRTIEEVAGAVQEVNETSLEPQTRQETLAVICSHLSDQPSVSHPPSRSIKVTTLQNSTPPTIRRFMHRLPMLLRMLLQPLAYFHPVQIDSLSASVSGKWMETTLQMKVFKEYVEQDTGLRSLEQKISSWLRNANFVLQLADLKTITQVPFITSYEILGQLKVTEFVLYRAVSEEINQKRVVWLGGMDASVSIPSFLLPHHEHLLPPAPTDRDDTEKEKVDVSEDKSENLEEEKLPERIHRDETNIKLSVHAHLPACFDQEILDFVAALVKAAKIIDFEKDPDPMDQEVSGLKDFAKAVHSGMKGNIKRAALDTVANDKWIAKLVGRVTKRLETLVGDIGYTGEIPVPLAPYRPDVKEPSKLLG